MCVISLAEREAICAWKAKLFEKQGLHSLRFTISKNDGRFYSVLGQRLFYDSATGEIVARLFDITSEKAIEKAIYELLKELEELPDDAIIKNKVGRKEGTIVAIVAGLTDTKINIKQWDSIKYV